MPLDTWAVAAVAIIDVEGTPLLLRTYTSPKDVLNSAEAPLHAHLYVGPEDVIKLQFVLFASLDRCEDMCKIEALPSTSFSAPASTALVGVDAEASIVANKRCESLTTDAGGLVVDTSEATASTVKGSAVNMSRLMSPTTDARFLGKLLESHRMRSYGFRSVTGILTLLVTVGGDAPADAIVPLCRALYECASAALCNPFRSPDQCWRAQEQLLWKAPSPALRGETPGMATSLLVEEAEGEDEGQRNPLGARGRGSAASARWPSLPFGAMEWSWPRPAPTSVAALTAEPTLALSRTFNTQLEKLLSSFTVTARSCIVE
ncbi:hypothetical protein, conserved [Leishmania tarentolae]|uniref:Sedlin n=1 Tax=Leishmania tarentolae TaxID=5689 RepID=A0A640KJ11_LEITA|nr:hypothetical protein, conserved [Leishmania tarentolae]